MASSSSAVQPRPLDLVNSGNFASPLAQLSLAGPGAQLGESSTARRPSAAPASHVPPINFNLFRSPSIYSVESTASLDTISADEHAFNTSPPETPSTPKASQSQYFPSHTDDLANKGHRSSKSQDYTISAGPSRSTLVPKRSFVVKTRVGEPERPRLPLELRRRPTLGRSKTVDTAELENASSDGHFDVTSIHGEQGADWGEDEAEFEWLDTGEPEAINGDGKTRQSPSKRLGKLKAVMAGHAAPPPSREENTGSREDGRRLRKALVFPRRAPPPPPGVEPHPNSPRAASTSPTISHPSALRPSGSTVTLKTSGSGNHLAVPDMKRPGLAQRRAESERVVPTPDDFWSSPSTSAPSTPRGALSPTIPSPRSSPIPLPPSIMIPLKDTDGSGETSGSKIQREDNRYSQMSFQSAAYSFYDLDASGPSTPRANTPTQRTIRAKSDAGPVLVVQQPIEPPPRKQSVDSVFPNGRYVKVSVSKLENEKAHRERTASDVSSMGTASLSPLDEGDDAGPSGYVAKGIEARGKGDLPRSAWYFMKAADAGSSTGRMYWGLALRHGWGVARDDKRAFAELRQACDESLMEGGINFYQSPGTVKLSLQQKKKMTRDVSLGMFEIANCFLEGVGVKKAPDIAMAYLRFAGNLGDLAAQEQLGFLLSKGGNGVRKDMKEAAKWYRMAIGQGSTNTFGLAWVWKDKYMH